MISFEPRGRQTLETFASRNAQTGQRSAAERGKTAEAADFIAQNLFVAYRAVRSIARQFAHRKIRPAPMKSVRQTCINYRGRAEKASMAVGDHAVSVCPWHAKA